MVDGAAGEECSPCVVYPTRQYTYSAPSETYCLLSGSIHILMIILKDIHLEMCSSVLEVESVSSLRHRDSGMKSRLISFSGNALAFPGSCLLRGENSAFTSTENLIVPVYPP